MLNQTAVVKFPLKSLYLLILGFIIYHSFSKSPCAASHFWPHSGRKAHTHTLWTLSHCLCSKSLIVLHHPLVSWPYLCSFQMDKATVQSCILSPSAAHNWIVRLTAWNWAQRSYLVCSVLPFSVPLTLLSLVLPLLFLDQSTSVLSYCPDPSV